MNKSALFIALCSSAASVAGVAGEKSLSFEHLWTQLHTDGQGSEIPAFDQRTNTIWVAGTVGVDVLDASTGLLIEHIDVQEYGAINSVAIHNGLAAFAIEVTTDRRDPGMVVFYDTTTRTLSEGINEITVGSLPDMLTFTRDGTRLLVANEGTPNVAADQPYQLGAGQDPAGTVSIIDMEMRALITNAGFGLAPLLGTNVRTSATVGMDFEPEYIGVDQSGSFAFVTLQEANAIALLDLGANVFTQVVGLGTKDFNAPGNQIDPRDNSATAFGNFAARGFYMPDSIAVYRAGGNLYTVTANEGDFREDNVDRVAASTYVGGASFLSRLRVSGFDSSASNLIAAGARSFSIRDVDGNLVYDSGDILDKAAAAAGIYDDGRSRDKGVEPEGIALLDVGGRTYAFVGLERTTHASVAFFDITDPEDVSYIDLIVTPGDREPEGLVAYHHLGRYYLAIGNEFSRTTTLYELFKVNPNGRAVRAR